MSISFTKTLFTKAKQSSIDSQELDYGIVGDKKSYAEKVSQNGLTWQQMNKMYVANVWVRACVDKIVNRVAEISPVVKSVKTADKKTGELPDSVLRSMERMNNLLDTPNNHMEGFTSIRKKVTRDILKYDAGSVELVKEISTDSTKNKINLYAIPGNTIKINVDDKGNFKKEAYQQVGKENRVLTSWPKERIMYFSLYPQSDRVYGLSPLESLIQTVTAELYASDYNLDFFYNNATPRLAVMMEKVGMGQASAAITRFRKFWDQELRGKPHRPIILATEDGNVKIEKMNMTNDEMQFQEYSRWLLAKIMVVYNMQPLILGVIDTNMGKMNSEEQHRLFKQDAIKPHLTMWIEKFNQHVVFSKSGLNLKDVYLDFDLDLIDKKERAEWHERYIRNGILTINEIRGQGLGLQPVPWGDVPYLQNNLVPFGADGSAVPRTPEEAVTGGSNETTQTPTPVTGKTLKEYIKSASGLPVGWEDMDPSARLEIVTKLIKLREKELSRKFIIPKSIKLEIE